MPVNLPLLDPAALLPVQGVTLQYAEAGIKKAGRKDVLLMTLAAETRVAGVFTRNRFCAAPVHVCREVLASGVSPRALIINTGNANAGTGQAGRDRALSVCAAVAEAVGCDPAVVAIDMGLWQPPAGRGARERVYMDMVDERQSFDIFDDAFNANPASMEAALEVLAASQPRDGIGRVKRGRRIAILGDMLELGPEETALHAAIARLPAMTSVDLVHLAGPRMRALYEALPQAKRGEWHDSAKGLVERASHLADAGDVVLIKGSKGSKVSLVVEALKKLGQAGAAEAHKGKE